VNATRDYPTKTRLRPQIAQGTYFLTKKFDSTTSTPSTFRIDLFDPHQFEQSWLKYLEAELLLAEVDLVPEVTAEETVDVDVEDADLVVVQTRTRRRSGSQLPNLVVL
jgi:hypothetical protein